MSDTTKTVLDSATTSTSDFPVRDKFSAEAQAQIDGTLERQAFYAKANAAAAAAWVGGA